MAKKVRVERYRAEQAAIWDRFVVESKNGTFLFCRNYMDYHSDRFSDHSLWFFQDDELIAVMPANVCDGVMSSHGGLTYGGIVCNERMKASTMLELFEHLQTYLISQGIARLVYKCVPSIYHRLPSDDDLYALFRQGAKLVRRDLSSAIPAGHRPKLSKGRTWNTRRTVKAGVEVRQSRDFRDFMAIATAELQAKHGALPTHAGDEMQLLADRFPDKIKLFGAYRANSTLGGIIMYDSQQVAHAQYIAATEEGRQLGAVDGVLDTLLNKIYADTPYFDFGISTENSGRLLNRGLIAYKESFGARGITYDTYELDIS